MKIKNKFFTRSTSITFLLITFTILFRLNGINRQIWNDEQISLNTLNVNPFLNPLYYGVTTNLPLYFYILKIYTINGLISNLIYLRFLGIILNTINVYLIYKFFKIKNFKYVNIFAAIIMAISPIQVHYAQEIRPYALVQLLIATHLILSLNFNKSVNNKKIYLISFLLLLSHYAGFIYLFCVNTLLIIKNFNKYSKKQLYYFIFTALGAATLLILSYTNPNFIESYKQVSNSSKLNFTTFVEGIIRLKEVTIFYYFYGLWYYMVNPIIQELFKKFIFIILIFGIGIILHKKHKILIQIVLLFCSILGLSFVLEKLGFYPFGGKHIMPFSFINYLLISAGLSYIYTLNLKFYINKIFIFTLLTILTVIFSFHSYCTNSIVLKTSLTGVTNSNTYQVCINKFQTPK